MVENALSWTKKPWTKSCRRLSDPCKKSKTFSLNSVVPNIAPCSISKLDIITYSLMMTWFLKQPSHHLLENMNTSKFLLDWHRCLDTLQNSWIKYWRTCICHCLPQWHHHHHLQQNYWKNLDHLQVFHKFENAKSSMKLSKGGYFSKEIKYLGHVLSTAGIKPLTSKTESH